jgi:segregation and condensation protein A
MAEEASGITISLPRYDGPLDLLVAMIRRNEWPIDDLPILDITSHFLAYVKNAKQMDIELGGDFVEFASWLVLLKSRSLLPHDPDAGPSPKEELRLAVLDHAQVAAAAEFLRGRNPGRAHAGSAGARPGRRNTLLPTEPAEETPTFHDVVAITRRAMESARAAASLRASDLGGVTVEEQMRWIGDQIAARPLNSPISTREWFSLQSSQGAGAVLLLAILELSRNGFLLLYQREDFAPVLVKALRQIPEDMSLDDGAFAALPT